MALFEVRIREIRTEKFRKQFLAEKPIPTKRNPNATARNPLPDVPRYTFKRWVQICLQNHVFNLCESGANKIADAVEEVDTDMFE